MGVPVAATMMFNMSDLQYQAVYNILSFTLASMSSTTMYLWFRASAVADKYKSAVYISGLVTFIAAYHYIRIFNSWVDAYSYEGVPNGERPKLTGVPFNDAYRYMDWLLTVPLLLIEILLVMKLEGDNFSSRAWTLGVGSALMIVSGYYGELVVTGDLTPRWVCWFLSMSFFLYIVYELLVGLAAAKAVVSIQVGYCCSDIISKCGVGIVIYQISYAKSGKKLVLLSQVFQVLQTFLISSVDCAP